MHDSGKIVRHFCPYLYPSSIENEISELEEYIGSHLGATARCYIYYHMLKSPFYNTLANTMTRNSSSIERLLWGKLLGKGMAKGMKQAMNINAESAQLSLEAIRTVFQKISDKLRVQNGKKEFLMDTDDYKFGFTAADLTFAAIASPLILPPELEPFLSTEDDKVLPKALVDLKYELRETLAGKHVLDMYEKHRLTDSDSISSDAKVTPKVVGRNKVPIGALAVTIGATLSIGAALSNRNLFQSKL